MRPVMLALRFMLELAALAALGTDGLHAARGPARFALAAALVLAVVAVADAAPLRLLHVNQTVKR
jgi:hypothetical protein